MKTNIPNAKIVMILIPILLAVSFVLFGPSLKQLIRASPDWIRVALYGIILAFVILAEVVYQRFRSKKKDD